MLELMLDRHVIYVLMGMSTFAGVVSKVVVGRTLRKLVAAAESMGKSNHPLMRHPVRASCSAAHWRQPCLHIPAEAVGSCPVKRWKT